MPRGPTPPKPKFEAPAEVTTSELFLFQGGGKDLSKYPWASNFFQACITLPWVTLRALLYDLDLACMEAGAERLYAGRTQMQWKSAEHLFHALKCVLLNDIDSANNIHTKANVPSTAKKWGRKARNPEPGAVWSDAAWKQVAPSIMYITVLSKFTCNTDLQQRLKNTDHRIIVEASPWDKIWGIGLAAHDPLALDKTRWKGTNWLGEALMRVRTSL
jgi:ribA/ribD-fused uncharacterized protein